ncbi:MAG: ABC transporter permease [Deltaproteobacteria bacterium]|nr:ABC transporter permease [Deltaproteobacteria bacterium]
MRQVALRRLLFLPLQLLAVASVCFFLLRAAPGNPFEGERKLPEAVLKNLEERYHLSGPWYEQWWAFVGGTLTFDFGVSLKYRDRPVRSIIAEAAPVSFALGSLAFVFGLGLAVVAGVAGAALSADVRLKFVDRLVMTKASLLIAAPKFLLGGLLVYLFSFRLRWLPPAQWGDISQVILPVLTLALPVAGSLTLLIRNSMLEVLQSRYVQTGRAKGLGQLRLVALHALPNAMHGVLSYLGPVFATLLTGSFVVEKIFAVPGMGWQFVASVMDRDYTTVLGASVFFAAVLVLANLVADLAAAWIDPRSGEIPGEDVA